MKKTKKKIGENVEEKNNDIKKKWGGECNLYFTTLHARGWDSRI